MSVLISILALVVSGAAGDLPRYLSGPDGRRYVTPPTQSALTARLAPAAKAERWDRRSKPPEAAVWTSARGCANAAAQGWLRVPAARCGVPPGEQLLGRARTVVTRDPVGDGAVGDDRRRVREGRCAPPPARF